MTSSSSSRDKGEGGGKNGEEVWARCPCRLEGRGVHWQ